MRSIWCVFVTIALTGGGYGFLMCPCNTDVLDALAGYNVNCGDTNVPFPRRLLLERRVWHSRMYRSLADFCSNDVYGILPFHYSPRSL